MKATMAGGLFVFLAIAVCATAQSAVAAAAPHVDTSATMSVARAAHQATLLTGGDVLITGGCADRCETVHASAELYDPAARAFRPAGEMATPRVSHAASLLPDGRVLMAGGWTGEGATASAEIYDPATQRFTSVGDMADPRTSPVAATLPDGRVLIVGGEERMHAPLASAEIFDPATTRFSATDFMRVPRTGHAAVVLADGRVLVTGGHSARGEILRSAEIFDPVTGEFSPAGDMNVARHKHAAVLLDDGRVLIAGGSDAGDFRGRYRSTEIYDPTTGKFSPGPDMRQVRHKLRDAIVLLPSGDVLVAGGAVVPEVFDPRTRAFTPVAGELSGPQMFATATLLPSGDVLILGGYDERIRASATAWLLRGVD